jgi:hypothetical protein
MKIFQNVGVFVFMIGMGILCFFTPWTSTPAESSGAHDSLGYAAIWSQRFATVAGARVDWGAFGILAGMVAFFAIVIAAATYFFRNKRGSEREDV